MIQIRYILLLHLFLCFFIPIGGFAQNKNEVDSLLRLLDKYTREDTTRVRILSQLCWKNRNNDFVAAIGFGKQAYEMAERINDYKGMSESQNFMGVVYRNMGDYVEATKSFFEALKVAEQHQVAIQIAYSNNNIGDILKTQKKFEEALPYAQKALELFKKLNDERGMGYAYVRLGEIYQSLAQYDLAITNLQKSLEIRLKLDDKSTLITSYNRIGTVHSFKKEYDQALEYYKKGLDLSEALDDKRAIAGCLDNIAWVYIRLGNFALAQDYALKSLQTAQEIKAKVDEKNAYLTLSKLYEGQAQYLISYDYYKKYVQLNDSIDNIEKATQLAKMQAIYDTKKKEQENNLLRKEKALTQREAAEKDFIIFFVTVAFLLTLGAIYLVFRSKQKNARLAVQIARENEALMQLGKNVNILSGEWETSVQLITQTIAEILQIERVSIWKLETIPALRIECYHLHLLSDGNYQDTRDLVLYAKDYTAYFETLVDQQALIVADDALKHPATTAFTTGYLIPLQIKSMLDVPFFTETGIWGIICCEAILRKKHWHNHEIAFVKSASDILTIAHQSHQRKIAEAKLQEQNTLLESQKTQLEAQRDKVYLLHNTINRKKLKLEKNFEILSELAKNDAIVNGEWQKISTLVTQAIVKALQVAVCQMWYYNFKEDTFYCIGQNTHQFDHPFPPKPLATTDMPIFGEAFQIKEMVIIEDAHQFSEMAAHNHYFGGWLHFQNLIIYPVLLSENQKGLLVCFDSKPYNYELEDISFLKSMHDEIVIAYQGYRRKQAQARLQKQNEEITSSINYARRIQTAFLPLAQDIAEAVPDFFILYQPRDIVSGDFYWCEQKAGKTILAAADCTGHGVPGAFMSMIGNQILNEVVLQRGIIEADTILDELHIGIRNALRQDISKNTDGMDVALVVIDYTRQIMEFAGAKNPIYYIQNNEIHKIKGNIFPIGGIQMGIERKFSKHVIDISTPTTFYLLSDGFQDQFGGPENRKFMVSNLVKLLLEIHLKDLNEQHHILLNTIQQWMKTARTPQTDDIMLIGARVGFHNHNKATQPNTTHAFIPVSQP